MGFQCNQKLLLSFDQMKEKKSKTLSYRTFLKLLLSLLDLQVSFLSSLWNHPFFTISCITLIALFFAGIHKRVVAPSMYPFSASVNIMWNSSFCFELKRMGGFLLVFLHSWSWFFPWRLHLQNCCPLPDSFSRIQHVLWWCKIVDSWKMYLSSFYEFNNILLKCLDRRENSFSNPDRTFSDYHLGCSVQLVFINCWPLIGPSSSLSISDKVQCWGGYHHDDLEWRNGQMEAF